MLQLVVSALLVFLGSVVLWLIKRPRRRMVCAITKLTEYQRDGTPIRLYSLSIRNRGNRLIEDTKVAVSLDAGRLTSVDPTEPTLIKDLALEHNGAQLDIPLLNPNEGAEIVLSVTNAIAGIDPKVSARARGVTATLASEEGYFIGGPTLAAAQVGIGLLVVLGAVWGAGVIIGFLPLGDDGPSLDSLRGVVDASMQRVAARVTRDSLAADSVEKGLPELPQQLFVLFTASGIADLYPEYVSGGEISYWRAGHFLFTRCVVDGARCRTYARAMDRLLEVHDIAPSSEGFNLYLASKMDRVLGDNQKADLYLDRLKANRPLMFQYLTRYDDSFDIAKLRRARSAQRHD